MLTINLDDTHIHEIALKLRSSKRTVFVCGAGISCNAGIPDFRSKDGLYQLVKQNFSSNFVQGKDLFDSILFQNEESAKIFYSFMAGLRQATLNAEPTPTHKLLLLLKNKRKLVRCYTQNIDGLEEKVGLGSKDAVKLHGDIHSLKCTHCCTEFGWTSEITSKMENGEAVNCMECESSSLARQMSGKRRTNVGTLRPNIVLYGEEHPNGDEIAHQLKQDIKRNPQLLIVAGTSLKVVGLKRLVKSLAQSTRAAGGTVVFVNKSTVSKSEWDKVFDFHVMSDCDEFCKSVKSFIPSFFERQLKIKVPKEKTEIKSEVVVADPVKDPLAAPAKCELDVVNDLPSEDSIVEPSTPKMEFKKRDLQSPWAPATKTRSMELQNEVSQFGFENVEHENAYERATRALK